MLTSVAMASSQPIQKTLRAIAGKETQAAIFGSPRPDCTSSARPEVRVLAPPKRGILRIGPRTLRTNRVRNCPTMDVPVVAVFYKPRSTFLGTDAFTLQVRSENGTVQNHAVTVEVDAAI